MAVEVAWCCATFAKSYGRTRTRASHRHTHIYRQRCRSLSPGIYSGISEERHSAVSHSLEDASAFSFEPRIERKRGIRRNFQASTAAMRRRMTRRVFISFCARLRMLWKMSTYLRENVRKRAERARQRPPNDRRLVGQVFVLRKR